jgi:hypothetical protein
MSLNNKLEESLLLKRTKLSTLTHFAFLFFSSDFLYYMSSDSAHQQLLDDAAHSFRRVVGARRSLFLVRFFPHALRDTPNPVPDAAWMEFLEPALNLFGAHFSVALTEFLPVDAVPSTATSSPMPPSAPRAPSSLPADKSSRPQPHTVNLSDDDDKAPADENGKAPARAVPLPPATAPASIGVPAGGLASSGASHSGTPNRGSPTTLSPENDSPSAAELVWDGIRDQLARSTATRVPPDVLQALLDFLPPYRVRSVVHELSAEAAALGFSREQQRSLQVPALTGYTKKMSDEEKEFISLVEEWLIALKALGLFYEAAVVRDELHDTYLERARHDLFMLVQKLQLYHSGYTLTAEQLQRRDAHAPRASVADRTEVREDWEQLEAESAAAEKVQARFKSAEVSARGQQAPAASARKRYRGQQRGQQQQQQQQQQRQQPQRQNQQPPPPPPPAPATSAPAPQQQPGSRSREPSRARRGNGGSSGGSGRGRSTSRS